MVSGTIYNLPLNRIVESLLMVPDTLTHISNIESQFLVPDTPIVLLRRCIYSFGFG